MLSIPTIDIYQEAITHLDLLPFFPLKGFGGHYNAKGNRFVAETIINRLKDDGIIPLEPDN